MYCICDVTVSVCLFICMHVLCFFFCVYCRSRKGRVLAGRTCYRKETSLRLQAVCVCVCVAAAQCCFSNHSLLPVAFVDNCCKLLRAPIIIFFQAQPAFMMAKRGEWPMGCEIARRRFLLTSATGAATVSLPQCRDAPRWAGLEFKRKRNSKKNTQKKTSGLEHNAVCAKWLDSSLMSVLSEKVERGSKHTPEPSAPSPLSLRSRGLLWSLTFSSLSSLS